MNYVGRIQLPESYQELFSLKIGKTILHDYSEKKVRKTGYKFFKVIKVELKSKIIVFSYI